MTTQTTQTTHTPATPIHFQGGVIGGKAQKRARAEAHQWIKDRGLEATHKVRRRTITCLVPFVGIVTVRNYSVVVR